MSVPPVPRRKGLSLAERRTVTSQWQRTTPHAMHPAAAQPAAQPRTRHCWVVDLPEAPGRWPGLLTEWQRTGNDRWQGRVLYAVTDAGAVVLVEAWVPADHLVPAP